MIRPETLEELQSAVRSAPHVHPHGGGTKPALSTAPDAATPIDLRGLAGLAEYNPAEFTFTALAGTRVADVSHALKQHGQYLPFDPPLIDRGATLGGTVASGLSGPGRHRYGGIRDFLLGVRFVDGEGQVVRAGGRVVKNAAGFDIPKLMVGSLGQFGVLVEMSFKVFPEPQAYQSVRVECGCIEDALSLIHRLNASALDIEALDVDVSAAGTVLWARLGGSRDRLPSRVGRLQTLLPGGGVVEGHEESAFWRSGREFDWAPRGWSLVKVPLTPRRIPPLEKAMAPHTAHRRYSAGGQVVWIATPEDLQGVDGLLASLELSGLVLFGPAGQPRLGIRIGDSFARRVKLALDPLGRFPEA